MKCINRQDAGKVAFVTGGGSGIGRATAQLLAARGICIMVADIDPESAAATAESIKASGGEASHHACDVQSSEQVQAAIQKTIDLYGRLDIAHNNAGYEGSMEPAADCDEVEFDRIVGVNLKGTWVCMKHEIDRMIPRGGGVIINTASIAAQINMPGFVIYGAAKAAVVQLTRATAAEYAPRGLRVNCICPGFVDTPMLHRTKTASLETKTTVEAAMLGGYVASPEEIATAVVWLCEETSSFVNGQSIVIDGGLQAQGPFAQTMPSYDTLRTILRQLRKKAAA